MRIAILGSRGIPASYGGFETFADVLSRQLVKRGYSVDVFCEKRTNNKPTIYDGVHLRYINSPNLGSLTTIWYDIKCLFKSSFSKYNIVYMLGYGSSIFCFLPRLSGSKVWINMDGLEWKREKWNTFGKTYLKMMEYIATKTADLLVADSNGIKEYLINKYDDVPIEMISYGSEIINQCSSNKIKLYELEKYKYYLVVCRLEPENYVREIIEGFVQSHSRNKLVIVGNHRISTKYVKNLLKYDSNRVKFLGTIYDQSKLKELRYHCFAYIHGHSVGGTNPSLLEAMAAGNRIIAQDNIFNREVGQDATQYFSCNDDLANIINTMETDYQHNREYSKNTQNIIRKRYNWDVILSQYEELIKNSV